MKIEKSRKLLKEYLDLVSIWWDDSLQAIYLKWESEFDEGSRVVEAVTFALFYVDENRVENWLVDISTSMEGLKPEDQMWVETEFQEKVAGSTLKKLALMPPLPETGQDTAWLDDWEKNTRDKYAGQINARLLSEKSEIKIFLEN